MRPPNSNSLRALKIECRHPEGASRSRIDNETAELCQWHVTEAHELESWSDARAYDGTVSIIQPLIEPLYNGKSALEIVACFPAKLMPPATIWFAPTGRSSTPALTSKRSGASRCTMAGSRARRLRPKSVTAEDRELCRRRPGPNADADAIELNIRRDPTIYDGQFSNNGWLQELPKPMTKLTWDNAVLIGPKMAERLQIKIEDVVELELNGKKVTGPVWIQAGHPDNSVTVTSRLRPHARRPRGHCAAASTFMPLRTSAAPWIATGVQDPQDRRNLQARLHAGLPDAWTRPMAAIVRWFARPRSRNTAKNRTSRRKKSPRPGSRSTSRIPIRKKTTPGAWRST